MLIDDGYLYSDCRATYLATTTEQVERRDRDRDGVAGWCDSALYATESAGMLPLSAIGGQNRQNPTTTVLFHGVVAAHHQQHFN